MPTSRLLLTSLAAAAASSALLLAGPANAAPPSDGQGYLDSTARCASVSDTVVFGSTSASRVAICKTADGLQYRGVRVRDGARLILPATQSGGAYAATRDGITYTVSSTDLVISAGSRTLREETMLDFDGTAAPAESTSAPSTAPEPPPDDRPPLPAEVGGSGS